MLIVIEINVFAVSVRASVWIVQDVIDVGIPETYKEGFVVAERLRETGCWTWWTACGDILCWEEENGVCTNVSEEGQ